jgi:hypothetical protein
VIGMPQKAGLPEIPGFEEECDRWQGDRRGASLFFRWFYFYLFPVLRLPPPPKAGATTFLREANTAWTVLSI